MLPSQILEVYHDRQIGLVAHSPESLEHRRARVDDDGFSATDELGHLGCDASPGFDAVTLPLKPETHDPDGRPQSHATVPGDDSKDELAERRLSLLRRGRATRGQVARRWAATWRTGTIYSGGSCASLGMGA